MTIDHAPLSRQGGEEGVRCRKCTDGPRHEGPHEDRGREVRRQTETEREGLIEGVLQVLHTAWCGGELDCM